MATKQAKRPKLKPVDPWPAYESPDRIRYDDRPELPEDVYREAGRHFTREAFEQVKAALAPPKNFDLLKRLREAAFGYHVFSAAQAGGIDFIPEGQPKNYAGMLRELINRTADLLSFCEARPRVFMSVSGSPEEESLIPLKAILTEIKLNAEDRRQEINLSRTGPARDIARRFYQYRLLRIFEEAKGEPMTSRTNSYLEKPYGPAFDFFSAAFKLIGANLAPNSINKYLKDTIRKRENVLTSKLSLK